MVAQIPLTLCLCLSLTHTLAIRPYLPSFLSGPQDCIQCKSLQVVQICFVAASRRTAPMGFSRCFDTCNKLSLFDFDGFSN